MKPRLTWEKISLKLRNPFRISYGTSEERTAYWIRLENDEGWGEGTIPPYYHISDVEMIHFWQRMSNKSAPFPNEPEEITEWVGQEGPAPARSAVDLALHDRIARQRNIPLFQLLGLPRPETKPSSFTIAIDSPNEMARMALQVADYPIIKVKLGGDGQDMARLAAIRSARPDVVLRLDANAGWTVENSIQYINDLEKFDLEMIEQPLPKEDIKGMGVIQAHTNIPIVADESVQTLQDVEALAEVGVKGINLKLMKVGGLSPAMLILKRARELEMKIMLGCMVETSIGTTAMAHLSGLADWLDLDAPILISNDPFDGMIIDVHANISLPERAGIGLVKKT